MYLVHRLSNYTRVITIQTKHFDVINSVPGNIFRQKISCCFADVCKHPILLFGVGGDFVDIKIGLFS